MGDNNPSTEVVQTEVVRELRVFHIHMVDTTVAKDSEDRTHGCCSVILNNPDATDEDATAWLKRFNAARVTVMQREGGERAEIATARQVEIASGKVVPEVQPTGEEGLITVLPEEVEMVVIVNQLLGGPRVITQAEIEETEARALGTSDSPVLRLPAATQVM